MLVLTPPVAMVEASTSLPPVWFVVLVLAALVGGLGAFIDYLLDGIASVVRFARRGGRRAPAERSVAM